MNNSDEREREEKLQIRDEISSQCSSNLTSDLDKVTSDTIRKSDIVLSVSDISKSFQENGGLMNIFKKIF
jgi:hypothetical protein